MAGTTSRAAQSAGQILSTHPLEHLSASFVNLESCSWTCVWRVFHPTPDPTQHENRPVWHTVRKKLTDLSSSFWDKAGPWHLHEEFRGQKSWVTSGLVVSQLLSNLSSMYIHCSIRVIFVTIKYWRNSGSHTCVCKKRLLKSLAFRLQRILKARAGRTWESKCTWSLTDENWMQIPFLDWGWY